ncbi:DUF5777 family beta-barrel protein [Namhaeicola litoreus]|uniref:DUF5777 family beta-barrel protein n=1 Tax=Namhaeicola litoreus TaxID=1052145 RepID=A0ABW3Y1C3_9FLAO
MKKYISLLLIFLAFPFLAMAQDDDATKEEVQEEVTDKPERRAFESSFIVDNPTDVVFQRNTMEVQMNHRFGTINFDENDMAGIWGASNIRLGLSYAILDWLTVGYGTTKNQRLQDFDLKAAILRQTRSGKMPINLTYYGNFVYNALKQKNPGDYFNYDQDRYSYFHQIIISRRFSPNFSMQIAPSISHYNLVEEGMENDRFAIAFGARYKISPQTAILVDYSQPITQFDNVMDDGNYSNHPGLSLGFEFATSAHAFQIFVSNLSGIVPQQNYMWNTNDFFNGDILLGFNITRVYNF